MHSSICLDRGLSMYVYECMYLSIYTYVSTLLQQFFCTITSSLTNVLANSVYADNLHIHEHTYIHM